MLNYTDSACLSKHYHLTLFAQLLTSIKVITMLHIKHALNAVYAVFRTQMILLRGCSRQTILHDYIFNPPLEV
ncbi:Uncharacterised protein [Escherichia coli]|nr:Uncharacterised protein [Escherichia coli]SQM88469.1 Uncharacterised protein [Escherichia coli]SQN27466.1 Uncharacterised protein [Escherichia coli]SQP35222.1 Uncharacterised protein [Escherichia coli]SQQ79509.1 Uncharacterised protein [Escherichia coli]